MSIDINNAWKAVETAKAGYALALADLNGESGSVRLAQLEAEYCLKVAKSLDEAVRKGAIPQERADAAHHQLQIAKIKAAAAKSAAQAVLREAAAERVCAEKTLADLVKTGSTDPSVVEELANNFKALTKDTEIA